ncbi:unnamed protein product [Paramecium octaurelia]|uniref:Uncharacterized protein n=1 Tax=Paramecium octaurelia TaxID=43137 RepID=A0A8S1WLJ4_PAROT|nr:unnamed protein product [Paramecium octaurelia]
MFLKQVFSGVQRDEEFLKILTRTIFTTLIEHFIKYFSYLIIFRLDELIYNVFQKMGNEKDHGKMNMLIQFLFDIEKIQTHIKPLWIEIYDPQYIQDTVIGILEQHFPMMKDLLSSLCSRATSRQSELVDENERPQPAIKITNNNNTIKLSQPVPTYLNKRSLSQVEEENKKSLEKSKKQVQRTYKKPNNLNIKQIRDHPIMKQSKRG